MRVQLPWSKLEISRDGGVILQFDFPLTPRFFLASAKEDLLGGGVRGTVNGLTNAKRAIDCQTDTFLSAIGFVSRGLEKQLGPSVIKSLHPYNSNPDQPLKFKILESLGIFTPAIVDEVRKIRHLLEHEYRKPTAKGVRNAIDVASLFVSACEGAMNAFLDDVSLIKGSAIHPYGGNQVPRERINIKLDNYRGMFIEISYSNISTWEQAEIRLTPTHPGYLAWLRVLFAVRLGEGIETSLETAALLSDFSLAGKKVKVKSIGYR